MGQVKKKSQATGQGAGAGNYITVFSDCNFSGNSERFEASNSAFKTNFDISFKEPVRSIIITGNPWMLYPEPGFVGRPTLLEEGKFPSPPDFQGLEEVGSIRRVEADLSNPTMLVFESSRFLGLGEGQSGEMPWQKLGDRTMRQVSIGAGGVWGVAKDNSLWFRPNSAGRTQGGPGDNWTKAQASPCKLIAVGPSTVWTIDMDNHCQVRTDVTANCPAGKNWVSVDGEYKSIAVSGKGHVWAVDLTDRVWWRKGAKADSPTGSSWKGVSGSLSKVSAGQAGVWGLTPTNQVLFRDGTTDDPDDTEGSSWSLVDGKFIGISVGEGVVWALGSNRELFYRSGIDKNTGNHWLRVEQPKDSKIVFKQVEVHGDTLVGSDKDNNLYYKTQTSSDVKAGTVATLYDDVPNFDLYNFPSRGSTYKVVSGGWVLYSEPGYQGKAIIHFADDCISNDPPTASEAVYKQWAAQFGSARPLRGLLYRTLLMTIEPLWESAKLRFERERVEVFELQNDTYEAMVPAWSPTIPVSTSVSHAFTLATKQNLPGTCIEGVTFSIPPHAPLAFPVTGLGPAVASGPEFHRLLEAPFTLVSETEAGVEAQYTARAKLPLVVPPKTKTQATVNVFKCTAKIPCKVHFKLGFLPSYRLGTEEWTDSAELVSVDRTGVKVETIHQNLNLVRKISNQVSGTSSKSL